MKKIIIALTNRKQIEKIKNIQKNQKFKCVQYREAILEVLEKESDIDEIYISEDLPGEISIEKLLQKIEGKNVIFVLKEYDIKKIEMLKNLKIENIKIEDRLIKNKNIKINKNIKNKKENKKSENKEKIENKKNKFKNNKIKINIENKKIIKNNNEKLKKNKIIYIRGKRKSGKTTIANLIINYLIKSNKKILIVNINNKIENKYIKIIKKYKRNKKIEFSKIKNNEIFYINNKIYFLNLNYYKLKKLVKENLYEKNYSDYDYIIIDCGMRIDKLTEDKIIEKCEKNLAVLDGKNLGIKELEDIKRISYESEKFSENGLHIIYNKYNFKSLSILILKKILPNNIKIFKIKSNKNTNIESKQINNLIKNIIN